LAVGGEVFLRVRQRLIANRLTSALAADGSGTGWALFDPDLHYRNRPNWQDHNQWGMRDHPVTEKQDNRFRVLLLGDSIGYYGDSIEDTYPGQLEAKLNANPALTPCEVLNSSTKGYTNYQQLLYLKKFGPELKPDAVAVAFCVNDLHRFLHQFNVVDGQIVVNSYDFTSQVKNAQVPGFLQPSLFLSWSWRRGRAVVARLERDMLFKTRPDISSAWQDDYWPTLEEQVRAMRDVAHSQDSPLFLIAFPHALQYNERYLARDRSFVLKPQTKLKQICDRLGLPLLDLYPALESDQFEDDGIHLTSDGRNRAAEAISEFIAQQQLIPPRSSG
jgi:lysophospholipase L1-like esterase